MLSISLELHLMRSNNGYQFCLFQKVSCMFTTKKYRAIPLIIRNKKVAVISFSVILLHGVRPNQIANRPLKWHLIKSWQFLQLFYSFRCSSDPPMDTEVILIHNANQRQGIDGVHDVKIDILIILFQSLLVKVHYLGHLSSFVISAKHYHPLRKFHFQRHQNQDDLHTLRPTVNVIPQKKQMFPGDGVKRWKQTHNFE